MNAEVKTRALQAIAQAVEGADYEALAAWEETRRG